MVWEAPASLFMASHYKLTSYPDQVPRGENIKLGQPLTREITPELARQQIERLQHNYILDEKDHTLKPVTAE